MEVRYGTYHLGSKIISVSTDLTESQLRQIIKDEPKMAKFIKIKADDNDKPKSDNYVEVVSEPAKPKQRRKRKSNV
jgi:hypothetical protein